MGAVGKGGAEGFKVARRGKELYRHKKILSLTYKVAREDDLCKSKKEKLSNYFPFGVPPKTSKAENTPFHTFLKRFFPAAAGAEI